MAVLQHWPLRKVKSVSDQDSSKKTHDSSTKCSQPLCNNWVINGTQLKRRLTYPQEQPDIFLPAFRLARCFSNYEKLGSGLSEVWVVQIVAYLVGQLPRFGRYVNAASGPWALNWLQLQSGRCRTPLYKLPGWEITLFSANVLICCWTQTAKAWTVSPRKPFSISIRSDKAIYNHLCGAEH